MATKKTNGVYTATHKSQKAVDAHMRKIAGRGGIITMGKNKHTFTYTFKK